MPAKNVTDIEDAEVETFSEAPFPVSEEKRSQTGGIPPNFLSS